MDIVIKKTYIKMALKIYQGGKTYIELKLIDNTVIKLNPPELDIWLKTLDSLYN